MKHQIKPPNILVPKGFKILNKRLPRPNRYGVLTFRFHSVDSSDDPIDLGEYFLTFKVKDTLYDFTRDLDMVRKLVYFFWHTPNQEFQAQYGHALVFHNPTGPAKITHFVDDNTRLYDYYIDGKEFKPTFRSRRPGLWQVMKKNRKINHTPSKEYRAAAKVWLHAFNYHKRLRELVE